MKREFTEDKHRHHHHHPNPMFSHHTHNQNHNFHLHSPPHLRPPTSEEADSHTHSPSHHSAAKRRPSEDSFPPPLLTSDGATIEVVRRPRGRPPGSKNKPKPPVVITRDSSEPSMSPYVLELPPGVDVIESTARFCRKKNTGLCVLSGNGVVANVTIKQPSTTPGATVTFHGRFDILSISATIMPAGGLPVVNGSFAISLAGPQGQVLGGHVVGPLVSAGTIYLIAASFNRPSFERLQVSDHEDEAVARGHDNRESPPKVASGGGDSGGGPVYNYQPSDVIWAPTARAPPPQPNQQPY